MNKKELSKAMREDCEKMLAIVDRKNSDYAGGKLDDDAFANFRLSQMVGVTPERGILVRMSDKLARVSVLLDQDAKVKDESIADSLLDLANYSLILKNLIKSKE